MQTRDRVALVVIVTLVGLLLRAGYATVTIVDTPVRADAAQYVRYAHNLVHHATFSLAADAPPAPDSFRSPGYPAFLGALLALGGEARLPDLARWIQALLGAALAPLGFWLARCLGYWPALAVALLTAISPHLIASTGYLLSEALTAPLVALALCLTLRTWRQGSSSGSSRRSGSSSAIAAGAGLAFAAAALTNEALAPLPLWIALAGLRNGPPRRALVWFLGCHLLVVGAWQLRCKVNVGPDAPTAGQRVLTTLSHGTYPGLQFTEGGQRGYPYRDDPEQPQFGASWQRFGAVLGRRCAERPIRHLSWYLLEKPCWLWGWNVVQGQGDIYVYPVRRSLYSEQPAADLTRKLMQWLHPLVVLLALYALLARRVPAPIALTLLHVTLVHTLFLPCPRYATPFRTELFVAAMAGALALLQVLRRRRSAQDQDPRMSIDAAA